MTEIPADLKAIEEDTLLGASYGGFEVEKGRLLWCARWVGDAPGDDPKDTTYDLLIEARSKVEMLGYELGDSWNDHDTAYFYVLPKKAGAMIGEKYYLIWGDYDGQRIETFSTKDEMTTRLNEIMELAQKDDYGTHVDAVILGKQLEIVSEEVKTAWKVKEKAGQ